MAAIWAAIISGGLAAAGTGLSYASSQSAASAANAMTKEQTGLARQLLLEGSPLRSRLLSGTPAPGDYDFVGMAERGEVQKQREAFQQLRVSGVSPDLIATLQRHIAEGNLTQLGQTQALLPTTGATTGIFPEFFATEEIPELLKPRPLPPLVNTYAPAREALEDQFDVAREAVLSRSGGRGGALLDALTGVETERARSVGALSADLARQQQLRDDQQVLQENALRQTLFGQGISLAHGAVPTAMNAFGNAASVYAGLAQSGQAGMAANLRSVGSSTALALSLLKNQGTQTNVGALGTTGELFFNPSYNQAGGISAGGFGAYNI
jgi:hypothetical protein